MNKEAFEREYGIRFLTLDEEIELPKYAKRTRNNKIQIINICKQMRNMLESAENRARTIPELNDECHAKLVDEFYGNLKEALKNLDRALGVGYE